MCRLCQTTAPRKVGVCSSEEELKKRVRALESCREEASVMTWSKESIGNSSTVEATPSGNASRKVSGKYESIRRSRRAVNGSTRVAARKRSMRVADSDSVRRKYLSKTQLSLQPQHGISQQGEHDSTPCSDCESTHVAPRRLSNVRRTLAFRRSSRRRQAFKERSPRKVPASKSDLNAASQQTSATETEGDINREQSLVLRIDCADTDSVCSAGSGSDTARPRSVAVHVCISVPVDVDPTLTPDTDICSLSSVRLTLNEGEEAARGDGVDMGPELVKLLETAEGEEELEKIDAKLDIGPEPVLVLADFEEKSEEQSHDVGPEPVEMLDTTAGLDDDSGEVKEKSTEEKRPSILRRMLCKSTSRCTTQSKKSKCMTRRQVPQAQRRRGRRRVRRMVRRPRKVVVMGDMFSGKSNLISAYCRDKFSTNYIPTLLNTCLTDAKVFGESIELVVVEVVGREDYAKLRKCAYHKIDAIILCYSADNPESLGRIIDYWVPELKRHAPKVPFILVATKKDIRDQVLYDEEESGSAVEGVVSTSRGQKVAKSIGAHSFLECSARYRDNTRNVFETAAKVALQKSRRKRRVRRNCQNDCIIS